LVFNTLPFVFIGLLQSSRQAQAAESQQKPPNCHLSKSPAIWAIHISSYQKNFHKQQYHIVIIKSRL